MASKVQSLLCFKTVSVIKENLYFGRMNMTLISSRETKKKMNFLFLGTPIMKYTFSASLDWHYTMAWLPASLLKTHRRLLTCATTIRVMNVYERRHYATMVKIRHGLATLNSNNSVVYGQKHKVWVPVFLVRTSGTF